MRWPMPKRRSLESNRTFVPKTTKGGAPRWPPPVRAIGAERGDQPKNRPLTTALLFEFRFVTLIMTLPDRFHDRYSPPWNELSVSVSSTVPVAASMIWICSLRTVVVPVDGVERDFVRLAVGEVEVEAHRGAGVPGRGDPPGVGRVLQGARVGGAGGPRVVRRAGDSQGGIGGELGVASAGIGRDVVAVGPVGAVPASLGRCIRAQEMSGRGDRRLAPEEEAADDRVGSGPGS